jgi:hypothetical protein
MPAEIEQAFFLLMAGHFNVGPDENLTEGQ